jgi:hypothetical protein
MCVFWVEPKHMTDYDEDREVIGCVQACNMIYCDGAKFQQTGEKLKTYIMEIRD